MSEIRIVIQGNPVAKGRARYSNTGGFVRAYTPAKTRNAETNIKVIAMEECQNQKWELTFKPLKVVIRVYRPIPKVLKPKFKALEGKFSLLYRPVTKPDIDNYIKLVLDGLNKVVYADDNQIVDISASKFYSENPLTEIIISEVM